jgi:hypothetical protein
MITEDYVSFEIAKLLKEKGFEQHKCQHSYTSKGEFKWSDDLDPYECAAPTHQMAMKWLREVHKVNIEIHYNRFGENYKYLIIYKPEVLDDIRSLGVYFHYEETVEAALKYVLEYLI